MTLSPGRYLLTLKVQANALGVVPVGTRYTLAVTFRASGRHSYAVTEITPNPGGYALDKGDFEQDGWQDGTVEIVRLVAGLKVEVLIVAADGGGLTAMASDADTSEVLVMASGKWRRAANQDDKPAAPAGPITPHAGPILYLPATCGWFNGGEDMGAILRWLATYRGRVGLNFEATGSTGNQGLRTTDWRTAYENHCIRIELVVSLCAAAGVPFKIDAINSNDFGKGWSASWKDGPNNRLDVLRIMGQLARDLYGMREWCIVQPVSEDDPSMPAALRKACFDLWPAAGWPSNRLCGVGIAETHTGELKPLKAPALASTDNGPAIEKHFGKGVWTAHTPNVERCAAYAKHYLSRGVHCSLYHRADRLHLLEHRAAYESIINAAGIQAATGGGSTSPDAPTVHPTVPPGPALTFRYVGRSLKDVAWSPDVDRSNKDIWPVKDVNDKPCNARLHGCRVGEKMRGIEWIKVGASSAHTVNAWAAPGTKYGQSFKPGDRCRFEIRDINNRVVDPSLAGECVLG